MQVEALEVTKTPNNGVGWQGGGGDGGEMWPAARVVLVVPSVASAV